MSASTPRARFRAIAVRGVAASLLTFAAAHAAEPLSADAMLERVRADLAGRRGIPQSAIQTVAVDEVIWRDTSLGCGKPTESYAQFDVEGWRIALEYKGERFDYRARKDGGFILCTRDLKSPR